MNRIFTLLLALLACTVHVSAQNSADTLRGSATVPGDSLIAVDEQALIERLAQLYRDRRAQNRHNLETADYLRTQFLYNLLDGRTAVTQPLVSAPAYTSAAPQSTTTHNDKDESYQWQFAQINARLSAIEQRLSAGVPATRANYNAGEQATLETLLRNQQELERRLNNVNRTTVVPTPVPVPVGSSEKESKQVRQLEARIAQLEQQRDALIAERDTLVHRLLARQMKLQPAPTTGVTVTTVPAAAVQSPQPMREEQTVEVPGDFRRTLYFRASSATINAAGQKKLRETAQFLQRFPTAHVEISGYASPDGARAYNERLAARRLQAVVSRLQQLGVPASRIVSTQSGISTVGIARELGRCVKITLAP